MYYKTKTNIDATAKAVPARTLGDADPIRAPASFAGFAVLEGLPGPDVTPVEGWARVGVIGTSAAAPAQALLSLRTDMAPYTCAVSLATHPPGSMQL